MRLTEATLAWEAWRARRGRRRQMLAWGSVIAAFALAVGIVAWSGIPIFAVGEKGEAVAVKLGNPEGEDLPLAVQAVPDPSMQAVLEAQRSAEKSTEETRVADDTATIPVAAKTTAKPATAQAKPNPAPPAAAPPPVPAKPDAPQVTEKIIKGDEKGNPYELVLKPQGEKISQNAWPPAWLFMPLPSKLDAGLLAKVQAYKMYSANERRELLREAYPDGVTLHDDTSLAQRPALWQILEAAGYDVANADYKRGKNLVPVVISFRLGIPTSSTPNPPLLGVQLEQSSGNKAVDEAVLYAFQRSTFANGTGQVANGRYTYAFEAK